MHNVGCSGNARTNISKTLPQLALNERGIIEIPQNVLAVTIFSTNVDLPDLKRSQIPDLFLFPFQMVLDVSLKFTLNQASQLCLCYIINTLHPLIFILPHLVQSKHNSVKKKKKKRKKRKTIEKNQLTNLFVWVVKHRDECRDASHETHIGLDLENNDKKHYDM